ncbi:MAG: iron ABC transporter permease [Clostridiales bacterium]|nr:iron ABC transporter permease [Clostridiales bacterium]
MEKNDLFNNNKRTRYIIVTLVLLFMLAILILLNISIGSVKISLGDAVSAIVNGKPGTIEYDILWKVRLPRMAAGIILGGALALSGFLLQTFFNNPIAGPFVLGISSGAKLAVAITMVFTLSRGLTVGSAMMIGAAFAGALLSMGFVLLIARRVRRASVLIISGVMIGYICSAITDFVVTFASDENIVNLHHWSQGSFSGTAWSDVKIMAIVIFTATVFVFLLSKPIGAYQLGETYAQSVGVNIKTFRVLLVLLSSILCATVTAFAGPVSFVGVAVPHLIKSFAKTAKPLIVIPLCFLGGAVFCLGCDLIARTIYAPVEMSISSVSSLFGAPVVIYIMARKAAGD